MNLYDKNFYKNNIVWAEQSAEVVVPIILELFEVGSIVDFGCGVGTWLSVFKKYGVSDIRGYDGEYVINNGLMIDESEFEACDLEGGVLINRRYDMAMSLEVAEHISEQSANMFIEKMTHSSDLILFSAAVPGQGGIGHINEQWQAYWARKFVERGYGVIDILREKLKGLTQCRPYYRQNALIYTTRKDILTKYSQYIVDSPNEYMLAETVDWIRSEYQKTIDKQNRKLLYLKKIAQIIITGKFRSWIDRFGWKTIGIYGMGDIGELLLNELTKHYKVVCFDNHKEQYGDFQSYKEKESLDVLLVTILERDGLEEILLDRKTYHLEDICNENQ